MAIYTRSGDKGETGLFGGKRVSKASAQIEAAGAVDELTTYVGYIATRFPTSLSTKSEIRGASALHDTRSATLAEIQKDLYRIMSVIAGATIPIAYLEQRAKDFEREIDVVTSELPKLNSFILPGGTEEASLFHILRVLTRKAERAVVLIKSDAIIIQYLNRLSDLFFTLARKYAKGKETKIKTL